MPSSLTHYAFNKDVLQEKENLFFLKQHQDIYLVGGQGPDPFFFFGELPNKSKKLKYGTTLHKVSPENNFKFMFEYANKQDKETKDILYAYIYGAVLHYLLDKYVHPYVFYRTGFDDKESFFYHTLFESHLDVVLIKKHYPKYKVSTRKAIKAKKHKVLLVSQMYQALNLKYYQDEEIHELSFKNALKEMRIVQTILYSRFGIKKFLFKTFLKNSPINSMSHPRKVKDDIKIDYLNLNKKTWKNPGSGIDSDASVIELINQTKEALKDWDKITLNAYDGNIDLETMKQLCDNFIYDGIKINEEMRFQNKFYEVKKK